MARSCQYQPVPASTSTSQEMLPFLVPDLVPGMVQFLVPDLVPETVPFLVPDLVPFLVPDLVPEMVQFLVPDLVPEMVQFLVPDLVPGMVPGIVLFPGWYWLVQGSCRGARFAVGCAGGLQRERACGARACRLGRFRANPL